MLLAHLVGLERRVGADLLERLGGHALRRADVPASTHQHDRYPSAAPLLRLSPCRISRPSHLLGPCSSSSSSSAIMMSPILSLGCADAALSLAPQVRSSRISLSEICSH